MCQFGLHNDRQLATERTPLDTALNDYLKITKWYRLLFDWIVLFVDLCFFDS